MSFSEIFSKKRIYLDYAAATPLLSSAKQVMEKYWSDFFYNPASIYIESKELKNEIENFRKDIAKILHVTHTDIIFTSGGTESDNLALLGVFEKAKETISRPHVIISSLEHSAVFDSAREIERRGGEVTILKVNENGLINIEELENSLTEKTILISVMLANNEIGTVEPIGKVSRVVKEYRKKRNSQFPYVHTDASQGACYLSLDVNALGVDLMTLDGAKIYGPKGIGVLVKRSNVEMYPIIFGGGQEKGLRAGTLNPSLIAGFTYALNFIVSKREKESERLEKLKSFFISEIDEKFKNLIINTPTKNSLPNIISVSFPGELAEFIAIKMDKEGILVSTGAACGVYKETGSSKTIKAIGKEDLAESTIRFSFGLETSKKDLEYVLKIMKEKLLAKK